MSQEIKKPKYKKDYIVLSHYKLCRLSMNTIYKAITSDRQRLSRPFGMRLTLHLDDSQELVHENFIYRVKSALKDYNYSFIYRYELSSTRILSY